MPYAYEARELYVLASARGRSRNEGVDVNDGVKKPFPVKGIPMTEDDGWQSVLDYLDGAIVSALESIRAAENQGGRVEYHRGRHRAYAVARNAVTAAIDKRQEPPTPKRRPKKER